jgi:RNA polymerase sigma-70 factor (ECF subfamily)
MMMDELEATVERCRSGDQSAWTALVGATIKPLYRLCASFAATAAEAEELTQDVYLKLWENLDRYHESSSFMAWAWRVAKNLLIDAHRRSRAEREAAWLDPEILDRVPSLDNPQQRAERRQRLQLVEQGLRQLEPGLAQLVLLRDFAGMSYQDIAQAMELPLGTVKSRLNRARLELATAVRRRIQIRPVDNATIQADGGIS